MKGLFSFPKDTFTGKQIKEGHIIAVRYVWNSYVGVVTYGGLVSCGAKRHAFFSPHAIDGKAGAYQIMGHINESNEDYDKAVFEWYNSEDAICPIKIKVYDNCKE